MPSLRAGSGHEERLYAEVDEWQIRVAKNQPNALAQLVSSVLKTRDAEMALRVTEELSGGSFATGRSDISAPHSTASMTLLLEAINWECSRMPGDLESESDESDAGSGHTSATISAVNTASVGEPSLPSGLVTAPNATPHHDKLLLKLVHALANLCDTRRGDNDQPSAKMSLAVTGTDPARTRAVLERAVDSSFSESYHDVLVKAYALYSLSVLVPQNKGEYMRQLAQLPTASIPETDQAARLIHRASRQLSQRSPRIIVPSYAVFPGSPNGFTATPIPFPTDSRSSSHLIESPGNNSRNGSRANSLFSVVVTPASYDSRGTSPIASPVSSSPEDKGSIASGSVSPCRPRTGNANPLLAQVLSRRLARGRAPSLVGSPTSGVTACPSQSMASFAPPDAADLQQSLSSSQTVPRPRAQSVTPERTRSATLPSSGIATRSLRALSVVDGNRSSRMRPVLPWTKRWSLWSAGDDDADCSTASAPTTPARGTHTRALPSDESDVNVVVASDIPDASSVRSAPVGRTYSDDSTFGGPLPPLHPALAKQEKCSRLLESRVCAQCGVHGGSFPQCARGCGVAWCSRECRMESRKMHKAVCGVMANGKGRMSTVG